MTRTPINRRTVLAAALLLNPLVARSAAWAAQPPAKGPAAAAKPRVAITTDKGVIVVELEAAKAPITSANFLRYVDAKKYDGGTIYRAARTRGGPPGTGSIQGTISPKARKFPKIAHESTRKTGLRHRAGTISMGRYAVGSATCDFFICASPMPYLDANPKEKGDNEGFAAFGQVVSGMPVVKKILALPTNGKTSEPAMKGQIISPPVQILSMKRA
jgi:peptidyl-prolyl cis-trans isomerase A (cyclophilin A)